MKLTLKAYRLRDHRSKDMRTVIQRPQLQSEQGFLLSIREGDKAKGREGWNGRLTPLYDRFK